MTNLKKKGDITIFLILGVILAFILLFFAVTNSRKTDTLKQDLQMDQQADQIKFYVTECLTDIGQDVIFNKIGLQGGYIDPDFNNKYGSYESVPWLKSGYVKIPYWYTDGEDISPTLTEIETKLSRYIAVEAQKCLDFNDLTIGGKISYPTPNYQDNKFDFNKEKSSVNVSINANDVSILYNMPIKITNNENVVTIEKFSTVLQIPLKSNLELANNILQEMKLMNADLNQICIDSGRSSKLDVIYHNDMLIIHDFTTYVGSKYRRTFTLQFGIKGLSAHGRC